MRLKRNGFVGSSRSDPDDGVTELSELIDPSDAGLLGNVTDLDLGTNRPFTLG